MFYMLVGIYCVKNGNSLSELFNWTMQSSPNTGYSVQLAFASDMPNMPGKFN